MDGLPELLDPGPTESDLSEIRGQEHAKRAPQVAAAGGHSVLTFGARRLLALQFGEPVRDQRQYARVWRFLVGAKA